MRVLIADDDREMAGFFKDGLEREGMAVDLALDGDSALELVRGAEYEVILLDVEMPGRDGFSVLRTLRAEGRRSAILMLTCRGHERDKLTGLNGGADDYVVKPCLITELIARIRAILRRTQPSYLRPDHPTTLVSGDLELDLLKRRVTRAGKPVQLSRKEHDLLEYFMRHPDEALSTAALDQHVWNTDFARDSNVVAVTVKSLRDKISRPGRPRIEAIRGVGYRFLP